MHVTPKVRRKEIAMSSPCGRFLWHTVLRFLFDVLVEDAWAVTAVELKSV